jgi:flagellar hook-length control protein FliK
VTGPAPAPALNLPATPGTTPGEGAQREPPLEGAPFACALDAEQAQATSQDTPQPQPHRGEHEEGQAAPETNTPRDSGAAVPGLGPATPIAAERQGPSQPSPASSNDAALESGREDGGPRSASGSATPSVEAASARDLTSNFAPVAALGHVPSQQAASGAGVAAGSARGTVIAAEATTGSTRGTVLAAEGTSGSAHEPVTSTKAGASTNATTDLTHEPLLAAKATASSVGDAGRIATATTDSPREPSPFTQATSGPAPETGLPASATTVPASGTRLAAKAAAGTGSDTDLTAAAVPGTHSTLDAEPAKAAQGGPASDSRPAAGTPTGATLAAGTARGSNLVAGTTHGANPTSGTTLSSVSLTSGATPGSAPGAIASVGQHADASVEDPQTPLGGGVDLQQAIDDLHGTIALAAREGVTQARIALAPPELGEIRINLTQTASGLLARVTAGSATALQALAAGHAELRQSLSSLGVELTNLSIGHHEQAATHGEGAAEQRREGATSAGETSRRGSHTTNEQGDPLSEDPQAAQETSISPSTAQRGALVDVLA